MISCVLNETTRTGMSLSRIFAATNLHQTCFGHFQGGPVHCAYLNVAEIQNLGVAHKALLHLGLDPGCEHIKGLYRGAYGRLPLWRTAEHLPPRSTTA